LFYQKQFGTIYKGKFMFMKTVRLFSVNKQIERYVEFNNKAWLYDSNILI
jgi:hypothetical protein